MKSVVFSAPFLTQSGYGVHSRQVVRWLLQRTDIDVRFIPVPWGDTPWIVNHDAYNGIIGQILQRCVSPTSRSDVSLQLKLPNEWTTDLAAINIGITAAVETDKCNPSWIDQCNKMDAVIVPSKHAKASLTNTGNVTKPFYVIPEAYSDAIRSTDLPVIPDFKTSFNFLVLGQLTGNNPLNDRKNMFFTLKWMCEALKNDADAGIVLKTNAGRNSRIDRRNITGILRSLLAEVRQGPYPRVYLLHGDMSDGEIAALYRHHQIKALVSLTRGEGYGLPTLEAAASGLPVIATGWSGHMDFLNVGKFINVSYQLGEIHSSRIDNSIFMKGARWANPIEEDFKRKLLKFRNSNSIPKQWANDLEAKLLLSHGQTQINSMYDEATRDFI